MSTYYATAEGRTQDRDAAARAAVRILTTAIVTDPTNHLRHLDRLLTVQALTLGAGSPEYQATLTVWSEAVEAASVEQLRDEVTR